MVDSSLDSDAVPVVLVEGRPVIVFEGLNFCFRWWEMYLCFRNLKMFEYVISLRIMVDFEIG